LKEQFLLDILISKKSSCSSDSESIFLLRCRKESGFTQFKQPRFISIEYKKSCPDIQDGAAILFALYGQEPLDISTGR